MKKLLVILFALLLLVGCGTKSDDVVDNEPVEEGGWVYEGVGYDALYDSLGKAEVDLSNADGQLAAILEKGTLVIATSPDYPPMEFPDAETGAIKGADILLAKYIANTLGVELVVEGMEFGAVITSVDTGKSDLAISGFGYTAERAESYEISHGYQADSDAAHHTILVPAADADQYNSLADFAGKKIYAQANSLQQMYVEDQLLNVYEGVEMELVSDINEAILGLSAGKADAIAFDSTTAINYANTSDGMFVSLYKEKGIEFDLSMYNDYAGNIVLMKKGETSLLDVVNQCIDQIMENGLYTEMYYAACDASGVDPTAED